MNTTKALPHGEHRSPGRRMIRAGNYIAAALVLLASLLAACEGTESTSASIPAYTLQSEVPAGCATVNSDGSITSPTFDCHVHVVFTDVHTDARIKMTVTGTFLASYVVPLVFASNSGASDGWALQFMRSTANNQVNLDVSAGDGGGLADNHAFPGNTYNVGDPFTLAVDVDRSTTPHTIMAWADTAPTSTADFTADLTGSAYSPAGSLLGVSLEGATLSGVTIEKPTPAGNFILVAAAPNGDLYTLDQSNGAATLLLDTSTDGTTDVGVVSSMLYFPATNALWLGTGGGRNSSTPCAGCVLVVNPATGVTTVLTDNTAINYAMPGLAMDSAGNIYTAEGDGDVLHSVDAVTGVATPIGSGFSASYGGNGMTFDAAGTLVVGSGPEAFGRNTTLYSVDTATGAGTLIGDLTFTGFGTAPDATYYLVAMATRPTDGTVFGLLKKTGGSSTVNSYLVTVNVATAEVTNIGQTDARYDGLEFVPETLITPP